MKKLTPVTKFFPCIYTHSGCQDITLGVHAKKIEDLLRVKCRLSNYENSSTFETVLYMYIQKITMTCGKNV